MPNELPPETAQRVLDYLLAVEESLHPSQSITIFRRITAADFEALHACKPDKVTDCKFISDELAAVVDGRGTYDKHERAGWVKRQPKPVVEPEEWGPWVKLAKVGERPAGVEFGAREIIECMDCKGDTWAGCTDNADALWCCATHYRRKRIRAVYEAFGKENDLYRGYCYWTINDEGVESPDEMPPGHCALRGTLWTPATVPEVTAAKAGRDPNGVVAWHGGECPEGSGIVHYQDGETRGGLRFSVRLSDWTRDDDPSDIIAYEVTG